MNKLTLIFTSVLLAVGNCFGGDTNETASVPRIAPNAWRPVVKLERFNYTNGTSGVSTGRVGTGFIVSKVIVRGTNQSVVRFLITNKHMVGDWTFASGVISNYCDYLQIFYYTTNRAPTRIEIKIAVDPRIIIPHPDPTVDIVAIALLGQFIPPKSTASFDISYLLPFNALGLESLSLGDQVFALGYPNGITSLNNNYPIAKAGYVASMPREEFRIILHGTKELKGKVYLVDGLLVGGNSGGPVVLPAEIKMFVNPENKQFQYSTTPSQNLVIGIVSMSLKDSGLTIVYSSDYIAELIESFDNRIKSIDIGSIEGSILNFK